MLVILMLELNKIHCMDVMEVLKQLPDGLVDLIIADPPYFNQGSVPKYRRKGKSDVNTYFGEWDIFADDREYLKFIDSVMRECSRVMKPDSSIWIFTNDRYLSYIRHMLRSVMTFATTIVWHKYNAPPRFIKNPTFISSKEFILFAYKGKPTFNKPKEFKEMLDVWITTQTQQK